MFIKWYYSEAGALCVTEYDVRASPRYFRIIPFVGRTGEISIYGFQNYISVGQFHDFCDIVLLF